MLIGSEVGGSVYQGITAALSGNGDTPSSAATIRFFGGVCLDLCAKVRSVNTARLQARSEPTAFSGWEHRSREQFDLHSRSKGSVEAKNHDSSPRRAERAFRGWQYGNYRRPERQQRYPCRSHLYRYRVACRRTFFPSAGKVLADVAQVRKHRLLARAAPKVQYVAEPRPRGSGFRHRC